MAVWQYDLEIVPKDRVVNLFGTIPQHLSKDEFESCQWWQDIKLTPDLASVVASLLPVFPSPWLESARAWGSDDGNRITIGLAGGYIEDILLRVDVRELDMLFLQALTALVQDRGWLFFASESGRFIEPTMVRFMRQIESSRAALFVSNPREFFRTLPAIRM